MSKCFVITTPKTELSFVANRSVLTVSHYEQNYYNILHMFSHVPSFFIFSNIIWDSDAVFSFKPFCYATTKAKYRCLHGLPSLTRHLKDKNLALPSDVLAIQTRSIRGTCNYSLSPSLSLFLARSSSFSYPFHLLL